MYEKHNPATPRLKWASMDANPGTTAAGTLVCDGSDSSFLQAVPISITPYKGFPICQAAEVVRA
jgi:hypothetical protein